VSSTSSASRRPTTSRAGGWQAIGPSVARPGWEEYLRTTGPPALDPAIEGCIRSPGCFHNHEAVEAAADLALLRTGLRSSVPGAKLAARSATRADAIRVAGQEEPAALKATARTSGPGPRRRLGIVSDANTYPLAYHALSTAMLAETVVALGRGAPPEALRTLRRAVEALAAYAGPDGDVAYLGRRQQQSWALAATVYAGTAAAAAFAEDRGVAARFRALASRALGRLERVHGVSSDGIAVVPRFRGSASGGFIGLDFTNTVVWNGLTVFLLDRAAEVAARDGGGATASGGASGRGAAAAGAATASGGSASAPLLTADRDGYFSDPAGAGFAAVRRGDVWLAVNARPLQPDLRYDAGLIALKRRAPDGTWRDLIRPRPMTVGRPPSSAGPVLVSAGREWFPYGTDLRVGPRGVVTLRGGFRDAAGADLGRPLAVRYAPLPDGVRISFALEEGETFAYGPSCPRTPLAGRAPALPSTPPLWRRSGRARRGSRSSPASPRAATTAWSPRRWRSRRSAPWSPPTPSAIAAPRVTRGRWQWESAPWRSEPRSQAGAGTGTSAVRASPCGDHEQVDAREAPPIAG